ncbi:dihydroorotase [Acetivibrio ethanolgignens]|uniref:Dihydroorotase n=1 Tax=Acetivibrio ethanolgignens TaxID=290052 RepID=A0A0V8QEG4_9FIRM|nr:dihydroorotase [Acetivibrio ethanolgignens]KSV58860.1 dihydroorotase [Acetivibrio ethanolgignens]
MRVLIKNGRLIDSSTGRNANMDLLIEDGKVNKVAPMIEGIEADTVINASGKFVMPGFIDMHVHLREPGFEHKETIKTGARAAARGGFTTICAMPNTKPVIDCQEMAELAIEKAKKEAIINVIQVGAITKGQEGKELADIDGMKRAGVIALSEDGKSVMDAALYREALKKAKKHNMTVLAHCEDKNLVGNGVLNAGKKAEELGMPGITNAVEDVIVARDILLAKETGARLHLCHCSTKDSVDLVSWGKEQGLSLTAEVCPHHFTLTEDDILGDDANYKMNPPLRSRADVEALRKAMSDGVMDVIATDHAPHSAEEKACSIKDAPFGIVGLETAYSLAVTELVDNGWISHYQLCEKLTKNPARILGIERGSLAVGSVADIVITDPTAEYVIDSSKFVSMGHNTPFDGKKVRGKIWMTLVAGNIVYRGEQDND